MNQVIIHEWDGDRSCSYYGGFYIIVKIGAIRTKYEGPSYGKGDDRQQMLASMRRRAKYLAKKLDAKVIESL